MNENNTHPLTETRAAEIWGDHAPAYLGQWRSMSDDRRAHAVHLLRVAHNAGRAHERDTNTEDDRPWEPLDGPVHVGDEVRRDFHGVTTIGVAARVDGEGDPFTAEGYLIGLRNYGTWYVRRATPLDPLADLTPGTIIRDVTVEGYGAVGDAFILGASSGVRYVATAHFSHSLSALTAFTTDDRATRYTCEGDIWTAESLEEDE